jgi:hypothetical protein
MLKYQLDLEVLLFLDAEKETFNQQLRENHNKCYLMEF